MAAAASDNLYPLKRSWSYEILPPDMSELRVVLLGNSWSQRSSVGNFILEENMFTTEEEPDGCLSERGRVKEKEIVLINTPDLLHPNIPEYRLRRNVETCVRLSDPGPHVFLLVLQPEDFTEEHKLKLCRVLNLFSDQSFDHSLVLISAPREESPGLMERYMEHPPLKDMIRMCRYRYLKQKHLEHLEMLTRLGQIVKENHGDHVSCDVFKDTTSSLPADHQSPKQKETQTSIISAVKAAESVQSTGVVLENVADDMSRDLLLMLVENISGLDDSCFSLEIIWESNRAAVTFSNAADVEKFLAVSQSSQKLQKHGLTARLLEAAESVRVESLPPTAVKDMLELYFEKNWALPDRIVMIPDEQAAIVTFKHPKVVENICTKRDYMMSSIPVRVYPYHESLGSALYGKERPAWKMPEPFTEKVHHVIWKFLQMKKLFQNINDQMQPYFCSVDLNNNEVKLSPLPGFLRQKGLNAELVNRWMSTALDAFRQQMSQYTAFECAVSAAAWKAAEKDVRSVVREAAVLVMDASRDTLTVAGGADDMKQLRGLVEDVVRKAITQIKRQTEAVSEGMIVPSAMFYILKQEGLQRAAQEISPDMSLSYDEGSQMITITGLPAEVFQTKSWILEKQMGMSKKQIDVPPGLLDFLNTVDPMDMSQDLFTSQGITAIYGIEDKRVMLLGSSDRVLADAESKMKQVLSLQTLDVEDQEVLKRHDWMSLNQQLLDTYNSSKKKTVTIQIHPDRRNKITVAGFLTPVNEISSSLREFIVNYSQVQETIRVKSGAVIQFIDKKKSQDWKSIAKANDVKVHFDEVRSKILLAGARVHVQKAKSCFLEMTGALSTDILTVDKPGAKKYFLSAGGMVLSTMMSELSCVVMLRPENYEVENFNTEFSDLEPTLAIPQPAGGRGAAASGYQHVWSFRRLQQNSDKFTSFLPARGEERLNTEALVLEREEFEPTVFQLCADNDEAVSQAKRRIKDLIVAEQAKRTITDSFISHLSRADMDQLSALQRKLTVSIRLEAGQGDQEPKIHLEGLTRDVFTAESEVRDIIKKVERSENQRKQAFLVSGLVEWNHQQLDGTMAPFDIYTNLQLEEALGRKQSVKIKINNEPYTADVRLKNAVSANGRKQVELLRKDLKAADDAALPPNWDDMKGDRLKLFPLAAGSKEYNDVEKELRRTRLGVNIIQIERVQNISLWRSYQQVKTDLEVKNKHKNNERQLFHGTGPKSIDLINKQGFNRSYAGQHAAVYGNGSYFVVDPAYSARSYAKPDARGQKRMYLARVLVGDYAQGRSGMIVPPARNTGNALDRYDSVVDNTASPTVFIVFSDTQAYPEYLITFT